MMRFSIWNVKPKVTERERMEFQNSHELFRKTRNGVLGLFPFHPFPMDENFIWVFRWFWSWGLQERRFEPVDQFWRTRVTAPTSKKNICWSVLSSFFLVTKVFQGSFFWPAPCAFRRVAVYWDLLVYHVTIAAPYPGGIDPRLAVYARSWDGHYTTTRRDRLNMSDSIVSSLVSS